MKNLNQIVGIYSILVVIAFSACSKPVNVSITSPDKNLIYTLSPRSDSGYQYNIKYAGAEVIGNSQLGFEFSGMPLAIEELEIDNVLTSSVDTSWKPVYGERAEYPDNYNESLITFKGIPYAIRIRAYDEGIAFRYEFTEVSKKVVIKSEKTEFSIRADGSAWVSSRAQSEITKVTVSDIDEIKERPILIQYTDSLFLAIGEAGLMDFSRMKFVNSDTQPGVLKATLDSMVKFDKSFNTPWRFVMVAKQPAQLLENNYLLLNLNEPNKIKDTSWIKPGKVIREVTLTTQGGMACVDFAVKHNLQYIEFDAGWYGNEYDDASDATTITVDPKRSKGPLDLLKVINYAERQGVGVILYVNRRALEKQLEDILPLLQSWNVKGIKYGFVNVGPQEWTIWLHDAVRKAAEHKLMIDIHDEYRPTGYSRTYPNLMTQEGIRGDEESTPNEMVISTIFTRMIAGAGDQTNCYFAPRVTEKMGSHTSQLAKSVCIYSPWQFIYWYDRPLGSKPEEEGAGGSKNYIQELPELTFFDQLPTVWDDTRVLEGYPGEVATIARKSGNRWFLGSITGFKGHHLSIKLEFLDKHKKYKAVIFTDDESLETATNVRIREFEVNAGFILEENILNQNGLAAIFTEIL